VQADTRPHVTVACRELQNLLDTGLVHTHTENSENAALAGPLQTIVRFIEVIQVAVRIDQQRRLHGVGVAV
jgi:hypothetical protein